MRAGKPQKKLNYSIQSRKLHSRCWNKDVLFLATIWVVPFSLHTLQMHGHRACKTWRGFLQQWYSCGYHWAGGRLRTCLSSFYHASKPLTKSVFKFCYSTVTEEAYPHFSLRRSERKTQSSTTGELTIALNISAIKLKWLCNYIFD